MATDLASLLGDVDVATVPGKCMVCRRPVEIPAYVLEMAKGFNHVLHRRREQPLTKAELIACDECIPLREADLMSAMLAAGARSADICKLVRQGLPAARKDIEWIKSEDPRALAAAIEWQLRGKK